MTNSKTRNIPTSCQQKLTLSPKYKSKHKWHFLVQWWCFYHINVDTNTNMTGDTNTMNTCPPRAERARAVTVSQSVSLFAASEGHPHGNSRNSETKSRKIDPKVPNRPPSRGLQTGHWQNPGSYSKKRIFGQKSGPVAGKRAAEQPNGHLPEN